MPTLLLAWCLAILLAGPLVMLIHELGHAVEGVSRRVHEIAVLGGVTQDGGSGGSQPSEPHFLHRSDELDEHERFASLGRVLRGQ